MTDIEINHPLEADKKIAEWKIRKLTEEIVRLRLKCGEPFTEDELLMGFAQPDGGFRLKWSDNVTL